MSGAQRPPGGFSAGPPRQCMKCNGYRNQMGGKRTPRGWNCWGCVQAKQELAASNQARESKA